VGWINLTADVLRLSPKTLSHAIGRPPATQRQHLGCSLNRKGQQPRAMTHVATLIDRLFEIGFGRQERWAHFKCAKPTLHDCGHGMDMEWTWYMSGSTLLRIGSPLSSRERRFRMVLIKIRRERFCWPGRHPRQSADRGSACKHGSARALDRWSQHREVMTSGSGRSFQEKPPCADTNNNREAWPNAWRTLAGDRRSLSICWAGLGGGQI
jgi:hypothetical protein